MGNCCLTGQNKPKVPKEEDKTQKGGQIVNDPQTPAGKIRIADKQQPEKPGKGTITNPNINIPAVNRDYSLSSDPHKTLTPIQSSENENPQNPGDNNKRPSLLVIEPIHQSPPSRTSIIDKPPTGETRQSSNVRNTLQQQHVAGSFKGDEVSGNDDNGLPDQIGGVSNRLRGKGVGDQEGNIGREEREEKDGMIQQKEYQLQRGQKGRIVRITASALGVNAVNDNECCC